MEPSLVPLVGTGYGTSNRPWRQKPTQAWTGTLPSQTHLQSMALLSFMAHELGEVEVGPHQVSFLAENLGVSELEGPQA